MTGQDGIVTRLGAQNSVEAPTRRAGDRLGAFLSALRPQEPTSEAPAGATPEPATPGDRGASAGVVGLETEYGITADGLSADEAAREMFAPVVAWGRSTSVFTPAGARLYLDLGAHPEYATAECSTLAELVAQDRAGDALVAELGRAVDRRRAAAGRPPAQIAVFKNNSDSVGHSFGAHENYQVTREGAAALAAALIPFLVTRQLVAGAGHIEVDQRGARYVLSARAGHVSETMSSASTRARPIINTRDEPHADGQKYRRLHVIVGDSNMSQMATRWKFGATSLVIAAAARGARLPRMELANPVRAISQVSRGWREPSPLELVDGRTARPASIQRAYLEVALEAAETAEDAAVIGLWRKALDAWDLGDFDGLETQLDWLAKLRLIERYQERSGAALEDARVARLALAYHQLGPQGLRGRLEASGMLTRAVSPWDVARAVLEPPPTTRARLRGRFVARARAAGREYSVDWMRLRLGDAPAVTVADPLDSFNAAAEQLIAGLKPASGRRARAVETKAELDKIMDRAADAVLAEGV
ncbi:MAG: proteasome accessory factor PafA2 family protein [Bifidobacteriaceae bacterium]|jgi:proteasome accessory factor A|nr:proteasome accessory factor PafA2 family protein [Bifidobacteriaceae bacterium]